jgi:hypothetical protein
MPDITLTEEERTMLAAVLEEYLSELRMEIADTDNSAYAEKLRAKKRLLVGVLHAVSAEPGPSFGQAVSVQAAARSQRG